MHTMHTPRRSTVRAATVLTGLLLALTPTVAHAAAPKAAPATTSTLSAAAYCGYYDGNATTRRGDTGDRVREIQCVINHWSGQQALAVDGVFGPRVESWVVYFQDVNGLRVDGIVGPQTWAALRAV
ncbi:peptidoglycan-binding domain-containing protein [Streptomyces sp. MST-110588]|uniref:peptidoglycan-binding domain-containing protein n=1 Tax=Streptomyces sp. MST-110588 TaxID=2833628 RepID=UPI001F5C7524|nr:peptidoglycan-binding domain-containing protein [Streptomyces sp. MST-110588]UNO41455.1 peptidoglycan-binding protein [Streptomyces sp. MST-110588]